MCALCIVINIRREVHAVVYFRVQVIKRVVRLAIAVRVYHDVASQSLCLIDLDTEHMNIFSVPIL